jgi:hypothetical protein
MQIGTYFHLSPCNLIHIWSQQKLRIFLYIVAQNNKHWGNYHLRSSHTAILVLSIVENYGFFLRALQPPWALASSFSFMIILLTVRLLGRVISSSQGLYLNTGKQKQNKHIHTPNIHALNEIRTHDPSVRASEDSSCLKSRGHRDRLNYEYTSRKCNGELNSTGSGQGPTICFSGHSNEPCFHKSCWTRINFSGKPVPDSSIHSCRNFFTPDKAELLYRRWSTLVLI